MEGDVGSSQGVPALKNKKQMMYEFSFKIQIVYLPMSD